MTTQTIIDQIIDQIMNQVQKDDVKDKFCDNLVVPLLIYVNRKFFPYFIGVVLLFLIIIAILLYILYTLKCNK